MRAGEPEIRGRVWILRSEVRILAHWRPGEPGIRGGLWILRSKVRSQAHLRPWDSGIRGRAWILRSEVRILARSRPETPRTVKEIPPCFHVAPEENRQRGTQRPEYL